MPMPMVINLFVLTRPCDFNYPRRYPCEKAFFYYPFFCFYLLAAGQSMSMIFQALSC